MRDRGAILLEAAAEAHETRGLGYELENENGVLTLDWRPMIRELAASDEGAGSLAARFMNTLIDAAAEQLGRLAKAAGLRRVVLSGGVFQNMYLMRRLPARLERAGLEVYTHSRVSANDEGVSLGQLMILEEHLRNVPCGTA